MPIQVTDLAPRRAFCPWGGVSLFFLSPIFFFFFNTSFDRESTVSMGEKISRSPLIDGLHEVRTPGRLMYVDAPSPVYSSIA